MSATAVPALGGQSVGRHPLTSAKVALAATVALLLFSLAGSAWVYSSQERTIAGLRQDNATLSAQLAQSQQEAERNARESRAALTAADEQLAQSRAETAEALATSRSLGDQVAQWQKKAQDAEAAAVEARAANESLGGQLAQSQKEAAAARATVDAQNEKIRSALVRAQLIDEFFRLTLASTSRDQTNQAMGAWMRKAALLNDPTLNKHLDAAYGNPGDGVAALRVFVYLAGSVVAALK